MTHSKSHVTPPQAYVIQHFEATAEYNCCMMRFINPTGNCIIYNSLWFKYDDIIIPLRSIEEDKNMAYHINTVWCRYKAVNFLKKVFTKDTPIARSFGWDVGCLLWIQDLIDILSEFLQWFIYIICTIFYIQYYMYPESKLLPLTFIKAMLMKIPNMYLTPIY